MTIKMLFCFIPWNPSDGLCVFSSSESPEVTLCGRQGYKNSIKKLYIYIYYIIIVIIRIITIIIIIIMMIIIIIILI